MVFDALHVISTVASLRVPIVHRHADTHMFLTFFMRPAAVIVSWLHFIRRTCSVQCRKIITPIVKLLRQTGFWPAEKNATRLTSDFRNFSFFPFHTDRVMKKNRVELRGEIKKWKRAFKLARRTWNNYNS